MNSNNQITFIYGDQRQIYLANLFVKKNWSVYSYELDSEHLSPNCIKCNSLESALNHSNIIVFPFKITSIPISNFDEITSYLANKTIFAGNIPSRLISQFANHNVKIFDYFKNNYVTRLNAIATAEGSIMHAIQSSIYNLHNNKALVIGYGNCGSVLAKKLKNLNCLVTVCCRNPYQGACAISEGISYINFPELNNCINKYKFIFNTVPNIVLDKNALDRISKDAIIIDIASYPGGIDLEYAKMINLNTVNIPGIPGKVSPMSSAKILYDYIIDALN